MLKLKEIRFLGLRSDDAQPEAASQHGGYSVRTNNGREEGATEN